MHNFFTCTLFFLFSFQAFGTTPYFEKQWLNFLRYKKTLFGYESEVDSPQYFFSKEGKGDPKKEWEASIKAFQKPFELQEDLGEHPICQFPGRYLYMKKVGSLTLDFPLDRCLEFQKIKTKLNIDSVSIIFSSYYINRPASAFGHTLFKVRNKNSQGDNELLDYGIDFSAAVTTNNPILYGVYGIIGGFTGRFNLMPYFLKLREYNDYESRDLFEFKLKLNEEQKELFVAHLWDMDKALFDYYYFSENCSYHIYRFLDAIAPDWDLVDQLSTFVAPVDTLTPFLGNPERLEGINFRPSLYQKLNTSYKELTSKEKKALHLAAKKNDFSAIESIESKAKVLDTLALYIDYQFPDQIQLSEGEKVKEIRSLKLKSLSMRSKIKERSKQVSLVKNIPIKEAHKSRRLRLGYGRNNQDQDILNLEFRYTLHGLEDIDEWYNPHASLEMGRLQLQYFTNPSKLEFKEFQVASVIALRPIDQLLQKISWNFRLGATEIRELPGNKISPQLEVGVGYSKNFKNTIFAVFAQSNQLYHKSYLDTDYRLDLGIRGLMKVHGEKWALVSQFTYNRVITRQHNLSRIWENTFNYAWTTNFSTSLTYEDDQITKRGLLNFNFYHQ